MEPFSAVIIACNEEDYIGRCLESLQGLADEVIVVDSFSTDATEAVCKAFNVRFIQHPFEGYIEQKDWALSIARNKWVLSLDADEALSDELKKEIISTMQAPRYDGYIMNRRNNYCGKWLRFSGWYPDRHLRLFDASKGKWGGLNPHDKFILFPGASTAWLRGDILHWNIKTTEEHRLKMENFSTIGANELFRKGQKASLFTALVHSSWSFFNSYVLRGGFLEGKTGFDVCRISAWGCWLKYMKLSKLSGKR